MKLSVLQILPELESGGVERGTVEVAEALTKQGHNALVISAGGRMVKELEAKGGKHFSIPVGKKSLLSLRYCFSLRTFIKNNHINVIDVRSRFPAWLIWLTLKTLKKEHRPVLITTVHGAYSVNSYSAIMVRGDYIVAVSDYIREYILKNYSFVDEKKITVIPRGVSLEEYHSSFRPDDKWLKKWKRQNPSLKNQFIITLVGRISEIKGQDDFIFLIRKLVDRGLNVHGLLVGGAQQNKKHLLDGLKSISNDHNLNKHISFLGNRNDVREIMSISNVILSLTKKPEAFGRTIIEALALGKPVLAYDHGGAREILKTYFSYGLVTPNDIDGLEEKITKISEGLKTQIIKPEYELDDMLDKSIDLYLKITNRL